VRVTLPSSLNRIEDPMRAKLGEDSSHFSYLNSPARKKAVNPMMNAVFLLNRL
jgi:hypothetical protein